MNGVGLPGSAVVVQSTASERSHQPTKKNGAALKRSAAAPIAADAPSPLSGPALGAATAIDAPMWPVHSTAWFQPEAAPAPPSWSGLAIERHARVAAPDFLLLPAAPVNRSAACDHPPCALTPAACPAIPQSGLTPLGWDPRINCPKEPTA